MEVKKKVRVSLDNPSIGRINERCINCGVCYEICEHQVGIDHSRETNEPSCINCGACVQACPRGALVTKYNYKGILNLLKDTDKRVAISVAPGVRVSLGEELGFPLGTNIENLLPSILRHLGFEYIFDVTFGADVTVMEEATELLMRLENRTNLPIFTSCCPSWVKYAGMYHPELLPNLSTAKSPIGMMSTLIKTYFREMNMIEDEIISVVVAPCTSKKYEILDGDTDYVITTRELAYMIKECNIDIPSLKPSEFDYLMGRGSKLALMFGRSGGVMEAVLSTAYYLKTKKTPKQGTFRIPPASGLEKRTFKFGNRLINVAVIAGMTNLEEILKSKEDYDVIEVMNCKGGCIGGGGQPLGPKSSEIERLDTRVRALDNSDNDIIYSYQNREIEELYEYYLTMEKRESLHTVHKNLSHLVKPKKEDINE